MRAFAVSSMNARSLLGSLNKVTMSHRGPSLANCASTRQLGVAEVQWNAPAAMSSEHRVWIAGLVYCTYHCMSRWAQTKLHSISFTVTSASGVFGRRQWSTVTCSGRSLVKTSFDETLSRNCLTKRKTVTNVELMPAMLGPSRPHIISLCNNMKWLTVCTRRRLSCLATFQQDLWLKEIYTTWSTDFFINEKRVIRNQNRQK